MDFNTKSNALKIIRYNQPERIQVNVPMGIVAYLGCNHEGYTGGLHNGFHSDETWQDIWGTTWRLFVDTISEMPVAHPLADGKDALNKYHWPDPHDERLVSKIAIDVQNIQDRDSIFLTGFHRDLLWEKACMLAGMDNIMIWFKTEPQLVRDIFRRIMDFQIEISQYYLDVGVEMVKFGDDLGGQTNSLFSHAIFEEFIYPEYKRIFDLYSKKNVMIYFHSCGKVERFLDDFIHLGVNILNPVQATANNLDLVRERTNNKIALEGGVNSSIVMHGNEGEVEKEVLMRMGQLGGSGGYFCKPDQTMPYPKRNLLALEKTVEQYGKYPLSV